MCKCIRHSSGLWTRGCPLARLALQGHREWGKVVCYKLARGRQKGLGHCQLGSREASWEGEIWVQPWRLWGNEQGDECSSRGLVPTGHRGARNTGRREQRVKSGPPTAWDEEWCDLTEISHQSQPSPTLASVAIWNLPVLRSCLRLQSQSQVFWPASPNRSRSFTFWHFLHPTPFLATHKIGQCPLYLPIYV